jgi:cell division protein FtsB
MAPSPTTFDVIDVFNDLTEETYKDIQSKEDDLSKVNLKMGLLSNKYGRNPNQQQQQDLDKLKKEINEIASGLEAEIKTYMMRAETILAGIKTDELSVVANNMLVDLLEGIDLLDNFASIKGVDELFRELFLAANSLLKQMKIDGERTPRTFAQKPDAMQVDAKLSQQAISKISTILSEIHKSHQAFTSKVGYMSKSRLNEFIKVEEQRLDMLREAQPDIKAVIQYLKSSDISTSKLYEMMGELLEKLEQAKHLPVTMVPIFMITGVINKSAYSLIPESLSEIKLQLESSDYGKLVIALMRLSKETDALSNMKISSANKVSDEYLSQLISENEKGTAYIGRQLSEFVTNNAALVSAMPRGIYDAMMQINKPPALKGKDADKIWDEYDVWYSKIEDAIRDVIDFTKTYYSIKMLYPLTIALRALNKKGRDVDNQDYVHSMQTLLNEALDGDSKIPQRKKALVAKLYQFYPTNERIVRAFYRTFGYV